MKEYLSKIVNLGVHSSLPQEFVDEIKAINSIKLHAVVLVAIIALPAAIYVPNHSLFITLVGLLYALSSTAVLWFNYVKKYLTARWLFVLDPAIMVLLLTVYFGVMANFQYLALLCFLMFIYLFKSNRVVERTMLWVYLTMALVGLSVIYFLDVQIGIVSESEMTIIRFFGFSLGTSITIMMGVVLQRSTQLRNVRNQETLLESQRDASILQTISDTMEEAIFKSSPEKGFVFVNESFAKMFGYDSKDEMISTHPVHLYESKSDRDALFMRIMSQGKVLNALIHYRKKDGSFFWGNLNCQRVMENGEDYLIGTIVDVTLQQEQTRLLEESEKQLREAQRLAKLGNWRVAPNEKTMEWSAECARIHGFLPSSTENAFDQWVDRLEDISFEEILDGLKKFAAMNRDFEFGSWYKTPNGERRYLYYICRLEESKSAYSWYGTVQDNTVLKNQEEELISTREFYQNILDSIPVEALLIAADKSFYYISKNAIGDDELRSWMIGKTNIDYVKRRNLPLDIAEQRNEMIERAFNGNLTVRWEEKMITRDGRDSYHLRNVIPIDLKIGDEEKRFLIVYSFDINDIKSAQFRLERKNDELEKLNKELDRFVYSISHDLRAPIASVLGLNALAEECEDNEEMESLLAMQREALDRLDRYIRDVIDYARNKRLDITPKHLSIAALIEECMTDLAYLNNYSEIEFFIDVEDDCSVFSDQVRVKIILNNLLSNAIKYIDHSKEKCIVSIKAKKIDGILHLEVTDNGIGIKEEFQDQIWEIFFRAISDVPGSGLGLYILKESIKNLKGSIDLESEEGKGTGFFLKIPDFEA